MASSKKVALIKQKNQGTVQINTCVEDPQKSIEELIQKSLEEHKRPQSHFERNLNRPKLPSSFNSRPNKRGSSAHSREGSSDDGFGSAGRQTSPSSISSSNVGGHFSAYQNVHQRQTSAPALIGYEAIEHPQASTSRPTLHSAGLPPIACYPKSVSTAAIPGNVGDMGSSDGYMMASPEIPSHSKAKSCDFGADSYPPQLGQPYSMAPVADGSYYDPKYTNQRNKSLSLDPMTVMSGNPHMYHGSPTMPTMSMPQQQGAIYGHQYQSPPHLSPYQSTQQIPTNVVDDGLGPLPDGWGKAYDANGETYFIDHNNKTTTWYDPRMTREVQELGIQQRHAISSRAANKTTGMLAQSPGQGYSPQMIPMQPQQQQQAPNYSAMDSVQKLNMERNYMLERQQQLQQQGLLPPHHHQQQQQQQQPMHQFGSSVPHHNQYLHPSTMMPTGYGHHRSISNDSALDNTMEVDYPQGMPIPGQLPAPMDPNLLQDAVTINPMEFDRYLHINDIRHQPK